MKRSRTGEPSSSAAPQPAEAAPAAGASRREKRGGRGQARQSGVEASSSAVPRPAPTGAALATEGSQRGKRVVHVQAKQSGVRGVNWHANHNCWDAAWSEGGKVKHKQFFVHRYMESNGNRYREADAAALRDAIAFRESLIRDGVIKAASAGAASAGRIGVSWCRDGWKAQIQVDGKIFHGGCFRPQDDTPDEIERARLAAVECRRQLELKHFHVQMKENADPSEKVKRESGVRGVSCLSLGLAWTSSKRMSGQRIGEILAPKDLKAAQRHRDLERRCRDTGKASSSTVPQPSPTDASPAAKGSQQGKRVVRVQAKRSGVTGVSWDYGNNSWQTQWSDGVKRRFKRFRVHWYMVASGKSYQEADAEALRDAVAFRESLIRDGTIIVRQVGTRGVTWRNGGWMALLYLHGKTIHGGHFRAQDDTPEEIERARLAAVECRRQLELKHFHVEKEAADPSERGKKRESGVRGVSWLALGLAWRSSMRKHKHRISKIFTPTDLSEESIEAARLLAVQHHGDLERRFRDTGKVPQAKQPKQPKQEAPQPRRPKQPKQEAPEPAPADAAPGARAERQQGRRAAAGAPPPEGVDWDASGGSWRVRCEEGGETTHKAFLVQRYMESSGKGYEEAKAEVLRDAIAFRNSLIKGAVAKVGCKPVKEEGERRHRRHSGLP